MIGSQINSKVTCIARICTRRGILITVVYFECIGGWAYDTHCDMLRDRTSNNIQIDIDQVTVRSRLHSTKLVL